MSRTVKLSTLVLLHLAFGYCLPGMSDAGIVNLQNATATFSQPIFGGSPISETIDGDFSSGNGWAIHRGTESEVNSGAGSNASVVSETAVFETVSDMNFSGGAALMFTLHQLFNNSFHNIGRFRLSLTTDPRSEFADGLDTLGDVTANWIILHPLSAISTNGATLSILGDDSILASGANPATDIYTITASTALIGVTGFRLEVLEDASLPKLGPGRFPQHGNFVLTEFQVDAPSGDYNHDGKFDAADYVIWRKTDGTAAGYNLWRSNFGEPAGTGSGSPGVSSSRAAVPEPTTLVLLMFVAVGWCLRRGPVA
jgi:hypothetical protein